MRWWNRRLGLLGGRRVRFADAVSVLALFLALAGGAYAISLGRNSVRSKQIAPRAVKRSEIAPGAVTTRKLANGAVTARKLGLGETRVTRANTAVTLADDGPGMDPKTSALTTGALPAGSYLALATVHAFMVAGGGSLPAAACTLAPTAGAGSDTRLIDASVVGDNIIFTRQAITLTVATEIPHGGRFRLSCAAGTNTADVLLVDQRIVPVRLKSHAQENVAPATSD